MTVVGGLGMTVVGRAWSDGGGVLKGCGWAFGLTLAMCDTRHSDEGGEEESGRREVVGGAGAGRFLACAALGSE
jgi:hypothetical protein